VATSEMSAREEAAWIDMKDVRKAEEHLRTTKCGTARHLLLAFAALSEPVRGGDLGRVQVCTENELPDSGNYLIAATDGGKTVLVLRDHKTSHAAKIGTLRRVLPKQLVDVVQASLLAVPRDWLFEAPRGGPFKEEAHFTAWANRIYKEVFGRAVTANILRHAFISAIDVNKTSAAALEATAARFGHSLATQMAYRRLSPTRKRNAPPAKDTGEMLVSLRYDVAESTESNVREGGPDTNELIAAQALVDMSRRPSKEPRRVKVSQIRMA
jgi:hypothetical protein